MTAHIVPPQGEQLFHHLFAQSSLGIAVEDLEGNLLLANPALCSMLGYNENELCSMSCSEFSNPEDSEDDWALFQRVRAGVIDHYSLEKRYVKKNGAQIWGRLNVSILKDTEGGLSPLVFAFVEDITDRKQAQEALRDSEERFRLAAQSAKMYAYDWDVTTEKLVRYEEYVKVVGFGDPKEQLTRQQLINSIHPEDRELFVGLVDQLTPDNPTAQISYRVLHPDGSDVWLEKSARASFDGQGRLVRITGMIANITERKLAEAALANVCRRLIEAQEQERTRIARELHDDVSQRLSLLAIELERLQQSAVNIPQVRSRMGELRNQASEIAGDIQSLSHELHSSKLQYLGLAAAMRGLCKEFGTQQNVEIDFQTHDLPSPLPPDVSLGFFRVLQEALHNSARHSGGRSFEVRLWGTGDEIHLTVRDSGIGFDPEAAKKSLGLGLISMNERLRLLNGTFAIESQPQRGTSIHASVPLRGTDSTQAIG